MRNRCFIILSQFVTCSLPRQHNKHSAQWFADAVGVDSSITADAVRRSLADCVPIRPLSFCSAVHRHFAQSAAIVESGWKCQLDAADEAANPSTTNNSNDVNNAPTSPHRHVGKDRVDEVILSDDDDVKEEEDESESKRMQVKLTVF